MLPAKPKCVDLKTAMPPKNTITDESPAEPVPSIIVRFLSRDVRNQIYGNRKLLRQENFKNFSVPETSNIFITENLTHARRKLFWNAKQKEKANHYKFYWTNNGNVFVKKSADDTSILIKNERDLNLIC